MRSLVALLALVAVATASYTYQGKYPGRCGYDGLYYKDDYSFIYCSNGNSYVQPCAPGTRNSAYGTYSHGGSYGYRDFCDVNLVDYGYAAYGHGHGNGYGHGHGHGGHGHSGHGHSGYGHSGHGHGGYGNGYGYGY